MLGLFKATSGDVPVLQMGDPPGADPPLTPSGYLRGICSVLPGSESAPGEQRASSQASPCPLISLDFRGTASGSGTSYFFPFHKISSSFIISYLLLPS